LLDYALPEYDAGVLVAQRELADYFEAVVKAANNQAKQAANWVMGELLGALNKAEKDISASPISAEQLGGLINRINDNTISGKIAKQVFAFMWDANGKSADEIISEKGLKQETDTGAIEAVINEVIAASPQQLADYRGGKDKLFGYFVGEVMKRSKGKANPAQVNELLKKALAG
jgi:aspartyl-tRNA(Asn)/glutamyl-tRNA(Gln) amidotransferase subunit B